MGRTGSLPPGLQAALSTLVEATADNKGMLINLAVNYGGSAEADDAIRRIIQEGIPLSEEPSLLKHYLYTGRLKEWTAPDLIIRTGREKRLSNFLPMQSIYSEWGSGMNSGRISPG